MITFGVKDPMKLEFYKGWFNNFGALYPIPHPYWKVLNVDEKHWIRAYGDCRFCDDHDNHRVFALSRSDELMSFCDNCYSEFNLYIFN